jgi:hypothetical protein
MAHREDRMTDSTIEAACRRFTPAAAALAFTGSAVAARRGVHPWEVSAFRFVNRMPDGIAHAMWVPMQAGALGAPLGLAAIQAIRGERARAARTAVTGFAAWAIAKGVKNLWMQPGAESEAAVAMAEAAGLNVIADGSCLLVVLGYHEH